MDAYIIDCLFLLNITHDQNFIRGHQKLKYSLIGSNWLKHLPAVTNASFLLLVTENNYNKLCTHCEHIQNFLNVSVNNSTTAIPISFLIVCMDTRRASSRKLRIFLNLPTMFFLSLFQQHLSSSLAFTLLKLKLLCQQKADVQFVQINS